MFARMRHWLAHKLGVNWKTIVFWWRDGHAWMAYRCLECRKVYRPVRLTRRLQLALVCVSCGRPAEKQCDYTYHGERCQAALCESCRHSHCGFDNHVTAEQFERQWQAFLNGRRQPIGPPADFHNERGM